MGMNLITLDMMTILLCYYIGNTKSRWATSQNDLRGLKF